MKKKLLRHFIFITLYFLPLLLHAQDPGNPGGDPDVPIDGGLSLLLAAGVGYVVKKSFDKRKKSKQLLE